MRRITLIGILIFLCFGNFINGQTECAVSCINKITSRNGKFFLRTIPFEDREPTRTGKTIVYTADSTTVYEIPRYFEIKYNFKELFISNNGKSIAYIIDREPEFLGENQKCITIYKDGRIYKEYAFSDLIDPKYIEKDDHLFYFRDAIERVEFGDYTQNFRRKIIFKKDATDFEKQLTKRPIYQLNDTLLIFCKTAKVVKLNLNTGNIITDKLSAFDTRIMSRYDTVNAHTDSIRYSRLNEFPRLANGKNTESELAEFIGMSIYKYSEETRKYKNYEALIDIRIDSSGNAQVTNIGIPGGLSEDKISKIDSFFCKNKFETQYIPAGIEKWTFGSWINVRNKNAKEAELERQQEIDAYKKRTIADSIHGRYIPKNLEECFIELNKLLAPTEIEKLKKLNSRDETSNYHMGLGLWLRNNWGLWGGSRLQVYLTNKGLNHPDDMSGLILEYYYDWLNGINEGWQEFDKKEKPKGVEK